MAVQKLQETKTFIEECWSELTKVTWPDPDQLRQATIVVMVFLFIISAMIWFMDIVVRVVIEQIMGIFGA